MGKEVWGTGGSHRVGRALLRWEPKLASTRMIVSNYVNTYYTLECKSRSSSNTAYVFKIHISHSHLHHNHKDRIYTYLSICLSLWIMNYGLYYSTDSTLTRLHLTKPVSSPFLQWELGQREQRYFLQIPAWQWLGYFSYAHSCKMTKCQKVWESSAQSDMTTIWFWSHVIYSFSSIN